ncbi:arylamine N-acetyltransferase family protein [Niallia sp. Krafla_26]|uniref:arylamine N-acetyltransferase family protein n=1 Tax=Niallia sp. Krafla_26 TaxID=3064703 RepID=UPI003D18215E
MDIEKYLDRIDAVKINEPTLDYLAHIQKQHVLCVPFENVDIIRKKRLSLNVDALYQKLVIERHGGVCYELNGSFFHLLEELGFRPYLMAGTVYAGNGKWAFENTHMFIIVPVDGEEYLVDVGFGGNCPRLPVPFSGEEVIDTDGIYRVKKEEAVSLYYLQKKSSDEWETLYRFEPPTPDKWTFETIQPICVWTETSPDSKFNKIYFLSRVTEDGRITLSGDTLTIVNGSEKVKEKVEDCEISEVARRYFGLEI